MTDANEIARRLTKAQREAVLRQPLSHQEWGSRTSEEHAWRVWIDVGRPLKHGGLIAFNENPRRSDTYFTPLGLAVRRALEQGEVG